MIKNKIFKPVPRLLSWVLTLAVILSAVGLPLTSCTAQDAIDIAAEIAEVALDISENAGSSETSETSETSDSSDQPDISTPSEEAEPPEEVTSEVADLPDENGSYDDRDSVALYIYTYGKLPSNYITKAEAKALGWSGGSLEVYAPGKCIGGSKFGNYEGLLPSADGRQYYECDIDTLGKDSRGAKRIVYSNDGLIYYTDDHYESFERLY